MNYYKKHLGDYAKKTGHLSPLEHGVYGLIMDAYYDREQGPTLIEANRWARARTEDEKSAVLAVLDEFFTPGEDGRYTQNRIEDELATYRAQAEVNRGIAVAREKRKRERRDNDPSTVRDPIVDEAAQGREPSHKPIANSHKPVQETLVADATADEADQGGGQEESGEQEDGKPITASPQVEAVFEHWKVVMDSPRSLLDTKRKGLVKAALRTGYTVEQLCAAIDGCAKSAYHMGQNDRGTKYNGLDLILRSAEKIDQFIVIGTSQLVPRRNCDRRSINDITQPGSGSDDIFNQFRREL